MYNSNCSIASDSNSSTQTSHDERIATAAGYDHNNNNNNNNAVGSIKNPISSLYAAATAAAAAATHQPGFQMTSLNTSTLGMGFPALLNFYLNLLTFQTGAHMSDQAVKENALKASSFLAAQSILNTTAHANMFSGFNASAEPYRYDTSTENNNFKSNESSPYSLSPSSLSSSSSSSNYYAHSTSSSACSSAFEEKLGFSEDKSKPFKKRHFVAVSPSNDAFYHQGMPTEGYYSAVNVVEQDKMIQRMKKLPKEKPVKVEINGIGVPQKKSRLIVFFLKNIFFVPKLYLKGTFIFFSSQTVSACVAVLQRSPRQRNLQSVHNKVARQGQGYFQDC
jgi:hypothetical protein